MLTLAYNGKLRDRVGLNSTALTADGAADGTDSGRYRYPNGLEVLPNGTAVLSASDYPGGSQQAQPFLPGGVGCDGARGFGGGAHAAYGLSDSFNAMLELGILTVMVLLLGLTVFLLRKTNSSEPVSEHEPD